MKRILRFLLIKILKIVLYIILGIFLAWLVLLLLVLAYCLTKNIENDIGQKTMPPHEDAWKTEGYKAPDLNPQGFIFDPKDWGIPTIWAPENQK